MRVTKFVHSFMTSLIVLCQKKLSAFRNFNHVNANCRLDVFLYKGMGQQLEYRLLWGVVQELLLLSHGQATVERGFSVERRVERHNLTEEESIVSQRLICDYVRSTGGVANVEVTKELLISVKAARQRYQAFLDKQIVSLKFRVESQNNKKDRRKDSMKQQK